MLQGISSVRSKAQFVAHISFSWLLIDIITVQLIVAVHILEIDVTMLSEFGENGSVVDYHKQYERNNENSRRQWEVKAHKEH